ncbi:MAG: GTP-binding protein, partial [Actinomycetota bacterium]
LLLLGGALGLTGMGLAGAGRVAYSPRHLDFIPQQLDSAKALKTLEHDGLFSPLLAYVSAEGIDEAREQAEALRDQSEVGVVQSPSDLLPPLEGGRLDELRKGLKSFGRDPDFTKLAERERSGQALAGQAKSIVDLLDEVAKLAREGRFDYLLIESTGISEPLPVAETFVFTDELGVALSDIARLDTMVTTVDAAAFLHDYDAGDFLETRGIGLGPEDERTIADLLIDQVEFADIIVVNKTDLVSEDDLQRLVAILRGLNPGAEVTTTSFGQVALDEVLDTGRFDFERASEAAGWMATMRGEENPETEEYGVTSFVWRARGPFHPKRLKALLTREWPSVLRMKGFSWIATRPQHAWEISKAGRTTGYRPVGYWWSAVAQSEWPTDPEARAEIESVMEGPWGDRRQEIVVIGIDMDEAAIAAEFDACLLTKAEIALGPKKWRLLPDPLPS